MSQYSTDDLDAGRLFEELASRSLSDQARLAHRYRDLLDRVVTGEIDPVTLRAEYDRLVTEQRVQLAREITSLGVHYYQAMLDLQRAYVDRLFDDLAATSGGHAPPPPPGPPEPGPTVVELALRGALGAAAEGSFVLENKHDDPVRVVFLLSELTGEQGEPVRAAVELDPPRLQLGPHQDLPVTVRVPLDPARFVAGRRYRGTVLVRGGEELELQLSVEVDPAEPSEPADVGPEG